VPKFSPAFLKVESALKKFVLASSTQDQSHIRPMHKYVSLRFAIEGGFLPEEISPRPPLKYHRRGNRYMLSFDFALETESERAIVGGVKGKNVDVVINKDGIGPVVATSVKGTGNAFRNLNNRMEEIIGDCANIHMMYPGLVYGFLHLIKATHAAPNIAANDICLGPSGDVVPMISRWHSVLCELTGRRMLSDDGTRYEAIALILAEPLAPNAGTVFPSFPAPDSPLLLTDFFRTLYSLYDLRFSYKLSNKISVRRVEWDESSPAFAAITKSSRQDLENALGYLPRLA
jgi:hypothetical protein